LGRPITGNAFYPEWFENDNLKKFYTKLQRTISDCRKHGIRRYEKAGGLFDTHFREVVIQAIEKHRSRANHINLKWRPNHSLQQTARENQSGGG